MITVYVFANQWFSPPAMEQRFAQGLHIFFVYLRAFSTQCASVCFWIGFPRGVTAGGA